MRRFPTRPTKRAIANHLEGLKALYTGAEPNFVESKARTRTTPKRQPESQVNDANKAWARLKGGVLYRNRRGMVQMPNGGMMPYGLGPNGTGDLVGYLPIRITADMVGRVVPVYTEIESKTEAGRLAEHQIKRIEELRDAGAIAGVARSAEDAEAILARWRR